MSIGFKNALLDSKRSYIRYISHELRTPLNTAYLGLKLLQGTYMYYDVLYVLYGAATILHLRLHVPVQYVIAYPTLFLV
jgi:signal transduction histidine kinase